MAYDGELLDRIRALLAPEPDVTEKRMFGVLAFLVGGHLVVAAQPDGGILARVGTQAYEALLAEPGVERMMMGGREMTGWVRVDGSACVEDEDLAGWVARGLAIAQESPPKS